MNQKIDYTALDAAIVAAVMQGQHRFTNISHDKNVLAAVLELPQFRHVDRTIDARLQSLKRQGKLMFAHKYGWRLKDKQP